MINRNLSVNLQNFPDVSFIKDEDQLITEMDLIRSICSCALFIRDQRNLRVRLPLKSLTVIGKNSNRFSFFKDIIADEVNVKSVLFKEEIEEFAEFKLQINFKKIGAKFGSKIKEITESAKQGRWSKISNDQIEIASVILSGDEFEIKLSTKNNDDKKNAIVSLPSNDYLVMLDVEMDKNLEDEGIARDAVRAIQQNRKDANFDISNRISVKVFSTKPKIIEGINAFCNYIKEQVLADELIILNKKPEGKLTFENQLEDGDLTTEIKIQS